MQEKKGLMYAGVTALMWGVLAIVLKVSLQFFSPVTITWFRFFVAFVFLMIYILITSPQYVKILYHPPFLLILAGIFLGLNYLGFISGVHYTSPATAQVFIQLGPLLLAISGVVLFKERITRVQLAGIISVFTGLILFYSNQIGLLITNKSAFNQGIIWVIFGAIAWTSYAISQKKLVKKHPANQLNLFIYGLPALFYLPAADFSPAPEVPVWGWFIIVFLGVNTLIAYGSLSLALKYTEANKVSVIVTMNPVITFIIMAILEYSNASWIMHENFTIISVIGAMMVLSGAAVAIIFSKRNRSGKDRTRTD